MAEGIGLPEPAAADKTFERRVALVTAIIAVVMAFSSLGGSNSAKEKKEIEPEARKILAACLAFGVLAALLGANGFLLLVKLPF